MQWLVAELTGDNINRVCHLFNLFPCGNKTATRPTYFYYYYYYYELLKLIHIDTNIIQPIIRRVGRNKRLL